MNSWKLWLILGLGALAMIGGGLYITTGAEQMTITEVADTGAASVTVTGLDLENIQFTVSATRAMQVVIPAGLMLVSGEAGTQNMMTAQTIVVALQGTPDAPDTQNIVVPVYCVNRYLETPTSVSSFSMGTVSEETEPVQQLAQCLEGLTAGHRDKQSAIWSISDHFASMDKNAFVESGLEHARSEMLRLGPDGMADKLQREKPDTPPEFVAIIRAISPDDLPDLFDSSIRPQVEVEKRNEFDKMRLAARSLLEQCGYDVTTLPMFASAQ